MFVRHSWGRRTLQFLTSIGSLVLIGRKARMEASRRIVACIPNRIHAMDLGFAQVDSFCAANAIGSEVGLSTSVPNQIPEHDKEIVAGALSSNTTLITGDSQLVVACEESGVNFFTPLQVVRMASPRNVSHIFFGERPTSAAGAIFARVNPFQLPPHEDRRRTIIFAPGLVWIYVTSDLKKWVCEFAGEKIEIHTGNLANHWIVVGLSWSEAKQHAVFRVSEESLSKSIKYPVSGDFDAQFHAACTADGNHHMNGSADVFVLSNLPISDQWKYCLRSLSVTPSPYDEGTLKSAIQTAYGNGLRLIE